MKKTVLLLLGASLAMSLTAAPSVGAPTRIRAFGDTPTDFHWHPKAVQVAKGSKVVWKNETTAVHTVTSYGGGWKKNVTIEAGATTGFVFSNAGFFKFRCTKHSRIADGKCTGMCGSVKVG